MELKLILLLITPWSPWVRWHGGHWQERLPRCRTSQRSRGYWFTMEQLFEWHCLQICLGKVALTEKLPWEWSKNGDQEQQLTWGHRPKLRFCNGNSTGTGCTRRNPSKTQFSLHSPRRESLLGKVYLYREEPTEVSSSAQKVLSGSKDHVPRFSLQELENLEFPRTFNNKASSLK